MGHKNDYSVIVLFPAGKAKKWGFVHKLNGFAKFLNDKHSEWLYMNVYERRGGQFLRRLYKGKSIPEFL